MSYRRFIQKVYPVDAIQWTGDNLADFARAELIAVQRWPIKEENLMVRTLAPRGFNQKEITTVIAKDDWLLFDGAGHVTPISSKALAERYEEVQS